MTAVLYVFAGILLVFLGYTLVAPTLVNLPQFSRRFVVHCPYLKISGLVRVKALSAALASAYGIRNLNVRTCTLLGRRVKCDEACLNKLEP